MCRNIKTLFNFEPPATEDEIHASALQFVRPGHPHEADATTARRGIDRAVRTAGGEHAEWRHRNEFHGMCVEGRPLLGDHPVGRSGVDGGEVGENEVSQGKLLCAAGDVLEGSIDARHRKSLGTGFFAAADVDRRS